MISSSRFHCAHDRRRTRASKRDHGSTTRLAGSSNCCARSRPTPPRRPLRSISGSAASSRAVPRRRPPPTSWRSTPVTPTRPQRRIQARHVGAKQGDPIRAAAAWQLANDFGHADWAPGPRSTSCATRRARRPHRAASVTSWRSTPATPTSPPLPRSSSLAAQGAGRPELRMPEAWRRLSG